jgi:hypothetical protein
MFKSIFAAFILLSAMAIAAQTEVLTNSLVIDMTKAGLSTEIIMAKIAKSDGRFDTSAAALIELKNAGVADEVIKQMMERGDAALPGVPPRDAETRVQFEAAAADGEPGSTGPIVSPKEAVLNAKTIAFYKSSANPSRQNLEKALLKRDDFKKLNLTILRYKEEADLFVEIGFVSGSWITHRYVYRIYDRRSGAVLAAGETTSWGSLAENLAKHITRSLNTVAAGS